MVRQDQLADIRIRDPRPTTPFAVVGQSGLLRLRRYKPEVPLPGLPPILLVYPVIKRPFVLDLLPERSVVRNLLRQGFNVYLTDWVPPRRQDSARGFNEYVNEDLARAVDVIRALEDAARVSLVGCCCGGLLCAIYAAFNPESVSHLVTFATPFEAESPLGAVAAEQIVFTYGNVPAWLIRWVLNTRMQGVRQTEFQLAHDLGEPELAQADSDNPPSLIDAVRPWLMSDVPVAGRLFLECVRDALPSSNLLEGRMRIGGRRVDLANIDCPVLTIAGARDELVPAECTKAFAERVGSDEAINLVFPAGHLGLMLSLSAHKTLWPRVGAWLQNQHIEPVRRTA
jgi:polyhydroxyalkanoate synthase